ncbi:type IV pilus assembly protein PilM [Isosphaeraceae bacterium EP7]
MAKIQAVWALDIGQAALKALKLVPGETPDTVLAEAFDFIEYPKILSQPDADPEALVREALATFMDRNELKGCKVAIGVPGQAGLVKFIKLPPVEKKRIPDIVKFEARQQIPFALEEVVWDYQQIGGDAGDGDDDFTMAEVGLFAMKRDQINRAILPLRVAGIEVDVVQMNPIALYNFIVFDQLKKGMEKNEAVVLLDMGADKTDLVITDGVRIWQRNVPIGGNHFTRALTKELKQTFAKAEHLKRNATKAPDPRQIFQAMRGVFNDYSSEITRSIGFYSSVNRAAKITKIVGMGNGFKLPGLQKFLQQNLSNEVERLDSFAQMTGDEVKNAPQFQENLASFPGVYGLALQGLGKAAMRTNLLPPEIEQVRMIRRKKPWVLAAAALLIGGFAALFLGDYKALAKVNQPAFTTAVDAAKSASAKGAKFKADYDAAKGVFEAKLGEGKLLTSGASNRAAWPQFLKMFSLYLPDPVARFNLNPQEKPTDQAIIDDLRVHIDAIKPVWRNDLNAEWFAEFPEEFKYFMHPLDRDTPPEGKGWVIQVIGHHYNPTPTNAELKAKSAPWKLGPRNYLQNIVIPTLQAASFRAFGVNHVALAWIKIDPTWTTEKTAGGNGLAAGVPILARASPPVAEAGEGGEGGGMPGGGMREMMGMMGRQQGGGMPGGGMGMPGGMGGREGMMGMMMGRQGGMMGGMGTAATKNLTTRPRTDFMIQMVWQPPTPEAPSKSIAEIQAAMTEAATKNKGVSRPPSDEALAASSSKATNKAIEDFKKTLQKVEAAVAKAEGGDAAAVADPGAAPAAVDGTTPAATPAVPATPEAPATPK